MELSLEELLALAGGREKRVEDMTTEMRAAQEAAREELQKELAKSREAK